MYGWGVNSTVTKHSDYFVWKDTSDRVTRRSDDTVDKKRVSFCVQKKHFLERVEQPEKKRKQVRLKGPFEDRLKSESKGATIETTTGVTVWL